MDKSLLLLECIKSAPGCFKKKVFKIGLAKIILPGLSFSKRFKSKLFSAVDPDHICRFISSGYSGIFAFIF